MQKRYREITCNISELRGFQYVSNILFNVIAKYVRTYTILYEVIVWQKIL